MTTPDLTGYEAASRGAAFFPQEQAGFLQITGEDRLAFIQRQTTNDVKLLGEDRALLSVLTSPTARILDVFYLLQRDNAIEAITLPGKGTATASFLKSRIFFNDKVAVHNLSQEVAQVDVIGPKAAQVLASLGFPEIPAKDHLVSVESDGMSLRLLALDPSAGLGYRLLAPAGQGQPLEAALAAAGCERLSAPGYLVLRVEAGQPEAGYELTDDYTPLEAGLGAAISNDKGCYTGQEIIARQVTYDKVTQHLRGLKLDRTVEPGDPVLVDGRRVGTITSNATSPRFGFIALAMIRRPHHEPGTRVQVGAPAESAAQGVIASLPFSAA